MTKEEFVAAAKTFGANALAWAEAHPQAVKMIGMFVAGFVVGRIV
jgi:hypothetical protein